MQLKNNIFLKLLFTPKFPLEHYYDKVGFIKKWVINPLKRWLAKFYLSFLQSITDIKVIGITGSAGKTTTKEMLAGILKLEGKTVYSRLNIDPVYNIPNTILRTPPGTKFLVLEMGVEYPGEMDFYLWLAKPDVGVITNIFPTHLEYFKNKEGVFKEKKKLVENLPESGIAILNDSDEYIAKLKNIKAKINWFNSDIDPFKQNSNAASKAAESLGVGRKTIKRGLIKYERPKHRLEWLKLKNGAIILDDSYNSNPEALLTALKIFISRAKDKKKIAVFGDMLELGEYEEEAHRQIGRVLADYKFDIVIGVGRLSGIITGELNRFTPSIKTYRVSEWSEALPIITPLLNRETYVIIKGSHSIKLYELVDKLS